MLPSLSEHDGKEKRKAKRTERQMRSFLFSACSSLLAALMKNTSRQAVSVSVSGLCVSFLLVPRDSIRIAASSRYVVLSSS